MAKKDKAEELTREWMKPVFRDLESRGWNPAVDASGDAFSVISEDNLFIMIWEDGRITVDVMDNGKDIYGKKVSEGGYPALERFKKMGFARTRNPEILTKVKDPKDLGLDSPDVRERTADEIEALTKP